MSEPKVNEKKVVGRSVAISLGIICILLIAVIACFSIMGISAQNTYNNLQNQNNQLQAWLNGNETLLNQTETWLDDNITYYNSQISDTISSLNAEIGQLNSTILSLQEQVGADNLRINSLEVNVTYLQDQLNELLNVTVTPLGTITSNSSAWVNRTVIVEGNLYSFPFPIIVQSPYSYELSSGGQMIGVSLSASVNMSASLWNQVYNNSASVRIYGIIEKGEIIYVGQTGSTDTYYIEALTVEPL